MFDEITEENIYHYFNNIFHEFEVLRKVIITEILNVVFHKKFIKFWIILFSQLFFILLDLFLYLLPHCVCGNIYIYIYFHTVCGNIYIYIYIYTLVEMFLNNSCPGHDTKMHPVVRLHFWRPEKCEVSLLLLLLPGPLGSGEVVTVRVSINDFNKYV